MHAFQQYQKTFQSKEARELEKLINQIDLKELNISSYNKDYILNMKPTLFYFFQMFDFSLQKLIENKTISNDWIIDFGGGHGFLSLYLKLKGFRVIYCDYNPNSVDTIKEISKQIGFGPDYYIKGSSKELVKFIKENNLKVSYLISSDTIEHVYDLDEMFKSFSQINSSIDLIFTTASNPENFIKSSSLRKIMIKDEIEEFLPLRKKYINTNYPRLNIEELNALATKSRGLMYQDLDDFVEYYQKHKQFKKINIDQYNCCDPQFGSWTERILPLNDYIDLGKKYNLKCEFGNGFYCSMDKKGIKKIIVDVVNILNLRTNKIGLIFSPFITIKYSKR